MAWKVDIGLDQLADDSYSVLVYDEMSGDTIATVYGSTVEEAMDRANIIADAY